VSMEISHEFVILSDFDTDLVGLKEVIDEICNHQNDVYRMGYYFRMIPFEGSGAIFLFQQLEYCFARVFYKFHNHEKSVPVMPGAGSCFKREILNSIFEVHSGLRNGEDRESTLIGIRLGYSVSYLETVLALTRPPLTYKKLVSQRIRWNLGYLETLLFERKYYFGLENSARHFMCFFYSFTSADFGIFLYLQYFFIVSFFARLFCLFGNFFPAIKDI
jgi:cellulose synthase/poly-beta-1,6-N-acetylglucosamine synthase-like glycosyltransferase